MMLPTISLRIERWKFNKDYGIYVSTLGNFKDRYKRPLPVKIEANGYCKIKTEAPHSPWKFAHRLVMLTWKPIPDAENLTVDHLNHNKRDNSVANLEWVTFTENQTRASRDRIKTISIFSPHYPLKDYQLQIKCYLVNGIECGNIHEAVAAALPKYGGDKQELYKKFGDAIKAIRERKCVAKSRITKKIKIEPVYYTTKVEMQKYDTNKSMQ